MTNSRPSMAGHTALLVIDMLNPYDHEDAEELAVNVEKTIDPMAGLIHRAGRRPDVDVIYINDNRGDFTADRDDIVRAALHGHRPDLIRPLLPAADHRFITKVRHSAFYSTPLDYLLGRLRTRRLVLAGQVTEQCILYTALDAYVRHLSVRVPVDAVAHLDPELGAAALRMMERNMRAELVDAGDALADAGSSG